MRSTLPARHGLLLLLALAGAAGVARAQENPAAQEVDLARHFGGADGTFVLLDPAEGRVVRHGAERAATRFIPASTFKIPHALIALEAGVASGADFTLHWDSVRAPRQAWWPAVWSRDNTLHSAIGGSVVWYFQEIARRVGPERMREQLARLGYGNRDISGGIDRFWLSGGLRVSADEQVEFLRRLREGRLDVSPRSAQIVRDALVLENGAGYRLSGKTGTAGLAGGREIGWLVGWVERGERVYYYALNVEGTSEQVGTPARRIETTKRILRELEVLPAAAGAPPVVRDPPSRR